MKIERLNAEPISEKIDWTRNFEDTSKDDVIYKKMKVIEILKNDPDLLNMLGSPKKKVVRSSMTEEEKQEIKDYNKRIQKPEIIPWLKVNGIIDQVQNVVMVEVFTERPSYDNPAFMRQHLICNIMIDETSMDTEFGIPRMDLVSYIIKDLFNRTDVLGMNVRLASDQPYVTDSAFYRRELHFIADQVNYAPKPRGLGNAYDRFN